MFTFMVFLVGKLDSTLHFRHSAWRFLAHAAATLVFLIIQFTMFIGWQFHVLLRVVAGNRLSSLYRSCLFLAAKD